MTLRLRALEIPDESAELAGWLERCLVGPHLGAVAAELSAVHAGVARGASLAEALTGREAEVLVGGLAGLPPAALRALLRQPSLLLELQDRILAAGGAYWDRLLLSGTEHDVLVEQGRGRLEDFLAGG